MKETAVTNFMYLHTQGGGHWRYVSELSKALQDLMPISLICSVGADPVADLDIRPVLSSIDESASGFARLKDRRRVYARQVQELSVLLEQEPPTPSGRLVHFQEFPTLRARAAVLASRAQGYRVVVTVHNVQPHGTGYISNLVHREAFKAWAEADALIVHSERLKEHLQALLPFSAIHVVPHPVWPSTPIDGVVDTDYLFFGVLRVNKGLFRFLDALEELGNPSASVVGSGSSEMVRNIRNAISDRGLDRCNFTPGYFPEESVPELFARHRVVVAPYERFEAQSGVTHLAMGYRRCVVVTDVGGLADPVRQYGVGEVAAGDGAEPLANAMRIARARQAEGAYEDAFDLAQSSLSMTAVAAATAQVYESVGLGRPNSPGHGQRGTHLS